MKEWLEKDPKAAIAASPWCWQWKINTHPELIKLNPLWMDNPNKAPTIGIDWREEFKNRSELIICNGPSSETRIAKTALWQFKAVPEVRDFLLKRLKPNFRYRYRSVLTEGVYRWIVRMPQSQEWKTRNEFFEWVKGYGGHGFIKLQALVKAAERHASRAKIQDWLFALHKNQDIRLGQSRNLPTITIRGSAYNSLQIANRIDKNVMAQAVSAYQLRDLLYSNSRKGELIEKVKESWVPVIWRRSAVLGYLVNHEVGKIVCPQADYHLDMTDLPQPDYYRQYKDLIEGLKSQTVSSAQIDCKDGNTVVLVAPGK
ncbi:MAG TPA: hypothetical protein V6D07_19080 [Trichocoleus sp.]